MRNARTPVLLALLVFLGGACTAPAPEGRAMTDDLGRAVTIPEAPTRLVSLAPSVTELVFAAGGGALLVGVTDADDYPPSVYQMTRLQALPLNHEAVAALQPDLVLASDQVNDPRDAEAMAALGTPTFFISIQTLPDVARAVRMLGFMFGTRALADATADTLETRLAGLDSRRAASGDVPSVIFLIGNETLFSFGPESYVHDMIAVAGGRSLTADMDTKAPILSEEFVIDAAPEVIFTAFEADPETLLQAHPSWRSVPAIASGRVFHIPADLVLRPGPRLIQGTESMADALVGNP